MKKSCLYRLLGLCISLVAIMSSTLTTPKSFFADDSIIPKLKSKGKEYLSAKKFDLAASCYSAILQVTEGTGGKESLEVRRKCGLTLAECEIKLGNLRNAIARCSEVIDDEPNLVELTLENDDEDEVKVTIGKAFYRRAIAFKRLKMNNLALLDFKSCIAYLPDDIKSHQEIYHLENSNSTNTTINETVLKEELIDIVEECQLHYPRPEFTETQIKFLLSGGPRKVTAVPSDTGLNPLSGILGNMGTMGPLMKSFGGMMGGLDFAGNNENSHIQLAQYISMAAGLAGINLGDVNRIGSIIKAIQDAYKKFRKLVKFLVGNRLIIMTVITFWLFYSSFGLSFLNQIFNVPLLSKYFTSKK